MDGAAGAVVSLTRQIARVGPIGRRARWPGAEKFYRVQTGIRRENEAAAASWCSECSKVSAVSVRVGWIIGWSCKPAVPGMPASSEQRGGAAGWSSTGRLAPFSPVKSLDSQLATTAIRGRWRRTQSEGSVARRRSAGWQAADSGRPSYLAAHWRGAVMVAGAVPWCRMIRIAAWAHGCSASFF